MVAKTDTFIGPMQDASAAVDKVQKKLEFQAKTFGLSARQTEIYRLAQQGATREQLRNAVALDKQITSMERWEAAVKAAQVPLKVLKDETERTSTALGNFGQGLGKRLFAANALVSVLIGGLNAASRASADMLNSSSFSDQLGDMAMGVPILGDIATIVARIGLEIAGAGNEARELAARLESVKSRLGLTAKEAERLQVTSAVLTNLEDKVRFFGDSSEVAMLKAAGATDKAILKAQILQGQLETLQRQQQNQAATDALIRGLEDQVNLYGASAREIALYQASVLGANAADLAYINTLYDKLELMKEIEDSVKRQNDLMAEGARVADSVRTAQEIYNDTIAHLQELLQAGAISEEVFRRAVEKAKEELERANQADAPNVRTKSASAMFQSPAAIERRFTQGMPTGVAASPELKTAKNTEQMLVDGRRRTSIQQQQLALLKDIRDRQPEVFGGNN